MAASLMDRFPAISDLETRAKQRMPSFAWTYLDSGTGDDAARDNNLTALAAVQFRPQFLKGILEPKIETTLFGRTYAAPVGIAPVGLTSLIWPNADALLAKAGAAQNIPYVLSTVGTETPEVAYANAGNNAWFQLYPPRESSMRDAMVQRVADAGIDTLVITADVPAPSRRERQRKAQIRVPPVIGPRLLAAAIRRPAWSYGTLRHGLPRFRGLERFVEAASMRRTAGFVGANLGGTLSWEYLAAVREQWRGSLVVKGILDAEDAAKCIDHGVDGVWVSNHGGRQLDGAISSIGALPTIVERVSGQVPVLFDSGIRDGLDIARALALGADFCFAGRAFMFGLGALGDRGPSHTYEILADGLVTTMHQIGVEELGEIRTRLA